LDHIKIADSARGLALAAGHSRAARAGIAAFVILAAAILIYLPFISLPFISDSYLQVFLGRKYGPISQWDELAGDVLYRSRATSLILTFLLDQWGGPDPLLHRFASILVHAANSLLVAAFGSWKRIGWKVSIPAAVFFAFCEVHQEAVIWVAALPELLVFFFSVLAILAWLRAIQSRSRLWIGAAFLAYLLALLSKESAVIVPAVAAVLWWWEDSGWRPPLIALAAMSILAAFYAFGIFAASSTHLHLNDGTFSIHAPFLVVLSKSLARLLFPWGLAGLAILAIAGVLDRALLFLSAVWMAVALLPYSFLTYMERVPSRHTYLASLGLALIVGAAFRALKQSKRPPVQYAAGLLALAIASHSVIYLWTKKLDQYVRRAEPTEKFLRFAAEADSTPIRIICAPYGFEAFRYAAIIQMGVKPEFVTHGVGPSPGQFSRSFCDPSIP
jgi:hypothetical protein